VVVLAEVGADLNGRRELVGRGPFASLGTLAPSLLDG
jgi:hypothetical protein